jgi:lipoyl-dependent peroxiredoxin
MATADRTARTTWEGPLPSGSGQLEFVSSGVGTFPVTWGSRVENPDGRTSPEELLAAAHASCFSMALSAGLGRAGNPPERLQVTATVSLDPKEGGGYKVARSHLEVVGRVPGLDQAGFEAAAATAAQACPISGSIQNNVEITHSARLES